MSLHRPRVLAAMRATARRTKPTLLYGRRPTRVTPPVVDPTVSGVQLNTAAGTARQTTAGTARITVAHVDQG